MIERALLIGYGAREHAIVRRLLQGNPNLKVLCLPGNAGISAVADVKSVNIKNQAEVVEAARRFGAQLVIIGPEVPLVEGLGDALVAAGIQVCGPSALAAQITEGSKTACKEFLRRHHLPTAQYRVFDKVQWALDCIRGVGPRGIVIKADGLCAGKGVVLPRTMEEAERALREIMIEKKFGEAGNKVVIEERLSGYELSATGIADGLNLYPLPLSRDYKRLKDGDEGPNTGGMGAHTVDVAPELEEKIQQLLGRLMDALVEEGIDYRGFIYPGLMIASGEPKILEINCRLGDPETVSILPAMSGNFAELCLAAATGQLASIEPPRRLRHALGVVLASGDYPNSSQRDDAIHGVADAEQMGCIVNHAGTAWKGGTFTTNGAGRVLSVVGFGDKLEQARESAYSAVSVISFLGMQYRKDIGQGCLVKVLN